MINFFICISLYRAGDETFHTDEHKLVLELMLRPSFALNFVFLFVVYSDLGFPFFPDFQLPGKRKVFKKFFRNPGKYFRNPEKISGIAKIPGIPGIREISR